jgi:AcrR family transcriptional regulator
MPRAQRREQIARTAATVFMRGGFDGTSMDDVAGEAGVTRLIVYRIFESKEDLYRAVLDLVIDDLAASFEGPLRMSPEADDQQRSIAGVLLGVARRHPDAFRLLWRHSAHEPMFRELANLFKVAVTDYAIALFEPSMTDATIRRWAAESVVSHLYESVCLWLDDGDERRDAEFLALITEGIRAMVTRWIEITGDSTAAPKTGPA